MKKDNTKQKLLPFNLEEALKNPERVVFGGGYISPEWNYFKDSKKVITLYQGISLIHDINGKCLNQSTALMLLPLPDKITKVYQPIYRGIYDRKIKAFADEGFSDTLKEALEHKDIAYIAILETTYNETNNEVTCKIIHKYEKDNNSKTT